MKRRIILGLILFAVVFTVACSSAQNEELIPEYDVSVEGGLGGYECIIYQEPHTTLISDNVEDNPFGYVNTSVFADDILKRVSDVEQNLNCKITLKNFTGNAGDVVRSSVAGQYITEVFYDESNYLTQDLINGYVLYPLETLAEIDITNVDKWGGPNILEIYARDGHAYAVNPTNWLFKQPSAVSIIVVNNALEKRFSVTNPREHLENGDWTWDTFEKTLVEHTVVDGENTYYGLTCRFFDFVKLSVFGNGVKFAYMDENDNLVVDVNGPKAIEGVEWAKKIASEYGNCLEYGTRPNDWAETTSSILEERSMMCLTAPWVLFESLVYGMDDFSIMPFPCGPQQEYGKWPAALEAAHCFSMMFNAREPEAAAKVISALCEPMPDYPTRDAQAEYLATNVLYDLQDAKVVLDTSYSGMYSYWYGTDFDAYWRSYQNGAILTRSIAQIMEANQHIFDSLVYEYHAPNLPIYDLFK